MQLNRRQFTTLAATLLGTSPFTLAGTGTGPLFLSAASDGDGKHWVLGFNTDDQAGEPVFKHALPARAHHIAAHEGVGIYVVVARRPGTWLWIGDLATGDPLDVITVPEDRHLYGHGVFSRDGSRFYTTENDWRNMTGDSGLVVAWDVARQGGRSPVMVRRAEYPTHGVGPHELLLKADQRTLVIANGGIRTHPDRDREKLNIDTMLPSLAYIDAGTGELLERHFLDEEYHQASIRHMDINAQGEVAFGMQYEGEPFHRVPLVGTHRQGENVRLLWAPEPQQGRMSQYVGSVRFDSGGRFFATSCPRGNMIVFWDADTGDMVRTVRSRDGCGICAMNDGFLFTSGVGRIAHYRVADDSILELDVDALGTLFWDNHLSMVAG